MQENKIKSTIETLVALGQYDALKALRDSLKVDYELARDAILSLSSNNEDSKTQTTSDVVKSENKDINYNLKWSLSDKFLYILMREKRFLKFREAARIIVGLEGSGTENKYTRKLTSATKSIKDSGKIVKVLHNNKFIDTFWGSPKWLDENGKIKQEYMYDLDALSVKAEKSDSSLFDDI